MCRPAVPSRRGACPLEEVVGSRRLLARRSGPLICHGHPGHPGHYCRRCQRHGHRQCGAGTSTGYQQQSRWRPSADKWHHFNGELSRNWMAVPAVLAFTATLAARAAFGRSLAVGFGVLSLKRIASAPSHLLAARLSRSQTPCSSSTSSKASFGLWCALGRLSRSTWQAAHRCRLAAHVLLAYAQTTPHSQP